MKSCHCMIGNQQNNVLYLLFNLFPKTIGLNQSKMQCPDIVHSADIFEEKVGRLKINPCIIIDCLGKNY